MGTRADFYIGTGPQAEWIGSVTYDGYPDGTPSKLIKATSEEAFRTEVESILSDPEITTTRPEEGWPWPWEDSRTSDYAYAWCNDGCVRLSSFGRRWETPDEHKQRAENDEDLPKTQASEWPNMSGRRNRDIVMAKSGLTIVRG